ncbi:MAG: carbon-nitrogen hydrolase family protein [Ectothiorhodospiraceae bacterium]|nr:carbon-nitrogen hydrolase family protein [Chromatiales bacterium]MCP5154412.1 carbon-nitrogen hydrolase family protein [Ectothiorhodospiraceae bacterium]
MRIGLASPPVAESVDDGLAHVARATAEAAEGGAAMVCFPEAYLPGLRGVDIDVPAYGAADERRVVEAARGLAREHRIGLILGMERIVSAGRQIVALVVAPTGAVVGSQTKNQLDPSEDAHYVPGDTRSMFEIGGLRFGVAICHEGWRYPETVRWAAVRGAKVVFHPSHTGSHRAGVRLSEWGSPAAPYYEKAMMCRGLENTIYFASVNYGLAYQEAATSLIDPTGVCVAHLPYGEPGVLVAAIDPAAATGRLAGRLAPERYREA